jgi:hypothetical protein
LEKCLSYQDILETCPDRKEGNWFMDWASSQQGRKEYPKVGMQQWQSCKISVQKGKLVGDIMEAAETAGSQEEVGMEEKVVGKKRAAAVVGKEEGGCKNKKKRK